MFYKNSFLPLKLYFTYEAKLIVAIVGYGGWNSAIILLTRR
jgi:ABC-type transport system involved in cytochrome bd biosynthesis fused ATPase/permease subunit